MVRATEAFHEYLFGKEFDIRVDHQPLSWLLTCKNPNSPLARWLIRISNYSFKIIYRSGKQHTNADALSRWPLTDENNVAQDGTEHKIINFINNQEEETINTSITSLFINEIEQNKDDDIVWIKELINDNVENKPIIDPNDLDTNFKRSLYKKYEQLKIINKILYWFKESEDGSIIKLIILPKHKINDIIKFVHCSILNGHLGVRKH